MPPKASARRSQSAANSLVVSSQPQLSAEQKREQQLDAIALKIRGHLDHLADELYQLGMALTEAKQLFPRGKNPEFLAWAKKTVNLEKSAVYSYLNVVKVFGAVLSSRRSVRMDATALILLAASTAPEQARQAAIALIHKGKSITHTMAKELIERHRTDPFDTHQDLVQAWGTLIPASEDAPLQLVTTDGSTYTFENYRELLQSYEHWRAAAFTLSLREVTALVAPYWRVTTCGIPKDPYRLSLECLIPGVHKSLVAKNPRSAHDWWVTQGKAITERLLSRQEASIEEIQPDEIASSEVIEQRSCLNCSWHDPNYPGLLETEVWCGFYRDSVRRDRVHEMPQACRKWHLPETSNPPFHIQPQSFDPTDEDLVLDAIVVKDAPDLKLLQPRSSEPEALDDDAFDAMLQIVPKLTPNQLKQLEQQIRLVKRAK